MSVRSFFENAQKNKIRKTCYQIYEKAKKMRPDKNEKDLLKIVLITKPPFDYQYDKVIERILEECNNIEELINMILISGRTASPLWQSRERNIKNPDIKIKNKEFFHSFWNN